MILIIKLKKVIKIMYMVQKIIKNYSMCIGETLKNISSYVLSLLRKNDSSLETHYKKWK